MTSKWTNKQTAFLCIGILLVIGITLLILKIRKFCQYTSTNIERNEPNTLEKIAHNIIQSTNGMLTNNYFTIEELCKSNTAEELKIDNTPGLLEEANLYALIQNVLNPLREEYGSPIWVHSGYRCPQLNTAVGGASTSQHLKGEAADIDCFSKKKNKKIFEILVKQNNYDQLIWEGEGEWVHVSYKANNNRGQILAQNSNGTYSIINNNWQTVIA